MTQELSQIPPEILTGFLGVLALLVTGFMRSSYPLMILLTLILLGCGVELFGDHPNAIGGLCSNFLGPYFHR